MNRTYLRLIRYFIFLMVITCLASLMLFFITLGYPASKDFHRLLRNHALFISSIVEEKMDKGSSVQEIAGFLERTAQSYEAELFLFDSEASLVTASGLNEDKRPVVTEEMQADIRQKGLFVQPSHSGKALIYVLPVRTSSGDYFLQIRKENERSKRTLAFASGLLVLLALLILAVYPLAKSFTKPLAELTLAVKKVSRGNFRPGTPSSPRNDELGELLQAFTDMAGAVDKMVESRKMLLADISHELRSPLGRLNITAELIKSEIEENEQILSLGRHVENIEYEIQAMDFLLRQLSDWSVLNLPDTRLNLKRTKLAEVAAEVFKRYQSVLEKKGVKLGIHLKDEDAVIMADRAKLMQVFTNLIDNAVHACPAGGDIRIEVQESDLQVSCSVSNTGPEIPTHLEERIFDPLFRIDPSRNRNTGGAGLGLAIVKKIMDHHNAEVICSRKGSRTVFTLTFERAAQKA